MKITNPLLPVLAIACLAGCTTTASKEKTTIVKTEEEKIIVIPPIKDKNSIHNKLHCSLPYRYKIGSAFTDGLPDSIKALLTGENFMELRADTTKLHIKGDSCWLEYISAGAVQAKRKDGGFLDMPTAVNETTDTLKIR